MRAQDSTKHVTRCNFQRILLHNIAFNPIPDIALNERLNVKSNNV